MATVITLAVIPFTFFLRKRGSIGALSSNHCALSLIIRVRLVALRLMKLAIASQLAFIPSGSPYDSVNPFTKSTSEAVSFTQRMA